jgi:hypothetical protein
VHSHHAQKFRPEVDDDLTLTSGTHCQSGKDTDSAGGPGGLWAGFSPGPRWFPTALFYFSKPFIFLFL